MAVATRAAMRRARRRAASVTSPALPTTNHVPIYRTLAVKKNGARCFYLINDDSVPISGSERKKKGKHSIGKFGNVATARTRVTWLIQFNWKRCKKPPVDQNQTTMMATRGDASINDRNNSNNNNSNNSSNNSSNQRRRKRKRREGFGSLSSMNLTIKMNAIVINSDESGSRRNGHLFIFPCQQRKRKSPKGQ